MIPETRMAVHHPKGSTLTQTAFWYTRCMELYSFLTYVAVRVPTQALYTNWEVPWHLVQRVYDSENAHGSTPLKEHHSDANGIFVHSLYGSVQLPDVHLVWVPQALYTNWEVQ